MGLDAAGLGAVVRTHREGSSLAVWATPGAGRSGIAGVHGDRLKVWATSPPEQGKANAEIAALLSELLAAEVRLLSGSGSRGKLFVVVGLGPAEVVSRLAGAT